MKRHFPPPPTKFGPSTVSQPKAAAKAATVTFLPPPTRFAAPAVSQPKTAGTAPPPKHIPLSPGVPPARPPSRAGRTLQRMEQMPVVRQPTAAENELLGRSCHRFAPIVALQVAGLVVTDQQDAEKFITSSGGKMGGGAKSAFESFGEYKNVPIIANDIQASNPLAGTALLQAVTNNQAVAIGVTWQDPDITFTGKLEKGASGLQYKFTRSTNGATFNVEKPQGKDYFALRDGMNWRKVTRVGTSTTVTGKELLAATKAAQTTLRAEGKTGNHWIYALPGSQNGSHILARDQQNPDRIIDLDTASMQGADDKGRSYTITQLSIARLAE